MKQKAISLLMLGLLALWLPLAAAAGNFAQEVEDLQRKLFDQAFDRFSSELKHRFPEKDFSRLQKPAFSPALKRNDAGEKFLQAAIDALSEPEQDQSFRNGARRLLFTTYRDEVHARFPYVHAQQAPSATPPAAIGREKIPPAPALRASDYEMNVHAYGEQRYPKALTDWLGDSKAEVFFHLGDEGGAPSFHQGFSESAVFLPGQNDPAASVYLMRDPKSGSVRASFSGVTTEEVAEQIRRQLSISGFRPEITLVRHRTGPPPFEPLSQWNNLKINANDEVIIGLKNGLWERLSATGEWTKETFTGRGTEADVFIHNQTGRRIFGVKNVYGAEITPILEYFYAKGARKIQYYGTTGAIDPKYGIGDLVLPSRIMTEEGEIPLRNSAKAVAGASTHQNATQGWVRTVLEETRPKLDEMRQRSIQSVDIETRYLAEFQQKHKDLDLAVRLIVSDQSRGPFTYDMHNATAHSVYETFGKALSQELGLPVSSQARAAGPLVSLLERHGIPAPLIDLLGRSDLQQELSLLSPGQEGKVAGFTDKIVSIIERDYRVHPREQKRIEAAIGKLVATKEFGAWKAGAVFPPPSRSSPIATATLKEVPPPDLLYHWTHPEKLELMDKYNPDKTKMPLRYLKSSHIVVQEYPELLGQKGLYAWTHPITALGDGIVETYGKASDNFPARLLAMRIRPDAKAAEIVTNVTDAASPKTLTGIKGYDLVLNRALNWDGSPAYTEWIVLNPDAVADFSADPKVVSKLVRPEVEKLRDPNFHFPQEELFMPGEDSRPFWRSAGERYLAQQGPEGIPPALVRPFSPRQPAAVRLQRLGESCRDHFRKLFMR